MNAFCKRFCVTTVAAVAFCATSIGVLNHADVFAANPTYTYKINTTDANNNYAVYNLGTLTEIGTNNNVSPAEPAYEFTAGSAYAAFFKDGDNGFALRSDGIYRLYEEDGNTKQRLVTTGSDDAVVLANKLSKYINDINRSTPGTITPSTTITGNTSKTMDLGYYLVIQTAVGSTDASNGYIATHPMLVRLTKNTESSPKNMRVELNKTVKNQNGGSYGNAASVTIGDVVDYSIEATVPDYGAESIELLTNSEGQNLGNFAYSISDSIPNSINVFERNIKVYVQEVDEDEPELLDNSFYTIGTPTYYDAEEKNIKSFAITFPVDIVETYRGAKIIVKYSGTTNENTISDNSNGNVNTASLTFSTNPVANNNTSLIQDTAKVYSYGFTLCKANPKHLDDEDEVIFDLYGAEFLLEKVATASDSATGQEIDNYTIDQAHSVGEKSCIQIKGLGAGIYRLTETKAATGYATPNTPMYIQVTPNASLNGRSSISAASNTGLNTVFNIKETDNLADGSFAATYVVYNRKATDLPETGAVGTIICVILGTAITTLGGYVLVRSNRKEQQ